MVGPPWRWPFFFSLFPWSSLHGGDMANWRGFDVVDVGLTLQMWQIGVAVDGLFRGGGLRW